MPPNSRGEAETSSDAPAAFRQIIGMNWLSQVVIWRGDCASFADARDMTSKSVVRACALEIGIIGAMPDSRADALLTTPKEGMARVRL